MWALLRMTVLHAEYQAELDSRLPDFKGSLLRGALGHSLKELSCARLEEVAGEICAACLRPDRCAGGALFDPIGPGPERDAAHDRPVPFVLATPDDHRVAFRAGDRLGVSLTLIGSGRVWLPWIIAALADLGWKGLGAERQPWGLSGLWSEGPVGVRTPIEPGSLGVGVSVPELSARELVAALPIPKSGAAVLRFLSPAHLQREKRLVESIDGPLLMSRLLRRLGGLLEYYERWDPSGFDFRSLIDLAARARCLDSRLERRSLERYSSRQGTKHEMTGLVGRLTLAEVPPEIWPYLVLGQWTHIGKSASFGMGRYRLEPIENLQA